jgi:hypothetical protein
MLRFMGKPSKVLRDYLRRLGKRGGKARLKTMTKQQRHESARNAARARWNKRRQYPPTS